MTLTLLIVMFASRALAADDLEFFESKVCPLLARQCYSCHSSKAPIVQGGLRLDSRETILRGGHSGRVLVPGNPDQSRLIRALRHEVEPHMPPWGKLEPEKIAVLEEWIRRGAAWPEERASKGSTEAPPSSKPNAKSHWAWQPITLKPPPVAQSTWPRDAIDRFLLHKLQQKRIEPAPPADPATLLRRVFAALITDLKARGLLEDTLVIWGGEFGRTPFDQDLSLGKAPEENRGREHNPRGFTMWLAGGGVKGGMVHGATDDFAFLAVDGKVHMHDLHATILHLLGLDHEKLTYRYSGRDFRLTDVYGRVVTEILA